MIPSPELTPIFVRAHTRVKGEKPRPPRESKTLMDKWARFALVLDCETTTDLREDLNFLWWRFCALKDGDYVCQQEGIVHADELPKDSTALIRSYAAGRRADVEDGCPKEIKVQSRTEFVNNEFWEALRTGAVIVCFNAPFDLSRLALEYRVAQSKNTGWSMVLWEYEGKPDKLKPRLRIKPKDSRSAFISLAGGDPENRVIYAGRFLDLSVLGWALRNKHMTLDGALESFHLEGKMEHEPTGRVTKKELEYGRRDVERTVALLNAMKHEYDGFPLNLPPERAMSAASITKAFLDEMKIKQPSQKYELPDEILGKCMQSYYGGRSEIRIRHHEVPVVVCDTTSEYPSVAVLLHLWDLIVAKKVRVEDCTAEARANLDRVSKHGLLDPSTWRELGFFASIKPEGDIVPVRALYSDSGDTNIGLNPLTCEAPIWYAGPDLAASKLKTGRTPNILSAFRLVPEGLQEGMKATTIGSRSIDPSDKSQDFFRAIIEERQALPKTHPHNLLLKIIANALYGIFAELNRHEYGKNRAKQLEVYSGEHKFDQSTLAVERPGRWHFAPAAALITAGGRLMLAILEHLVQERGGSYLLTDTDSMLFVASRRGGLVPCPGGPHQLRGIGTAIKAITWREVEEICAEVNSLNPYDSTRISAILKIEDCNYDLKGKQHQLHGFAISAKRYEIHKWQKNKFEIIKPSEHGLGIVFVPDPRKRYLPADCKDQKTTYPRWIVEAWRELLGNHFRRVKNPENALVERELWFARFPAMMRIRVTTPNVLRALRRRDPGAAKPFNFAQSPILLQPPPDCTLIASFSKHPEDWLTRPYVEIHTGEFVSLSGKYAPQTLADVLWRYYLHPEDKSLSPDGERCGPYTSGLLQRRPIHAMLPFRYIGKEVERKAQEGEDISILNNSGPTQYQPRQTLRTRSADPRLILRAARFSQRRLRRVARMSQHAVERVLRGERVHPSTRARLLQAVEKLESESKEKGSGHAIQES